MQEGNGLVSIIVPIYNVEKYVVQCIESLIKQSYTNIEILLVDDGTPDKCASIIDSICHIDNRIQVIHKHNGGLSDARNIGIEMIRGQYISFIDSDDWIEPNYIETMVTTSQNEDADIVTCSFINEYEKTGDVGQPAKEYFSGDSEKALALLYDQTRITVAAMKFYRRYIWDSLRFPTGKLYEDTLTTFKAFHNAHRIVQIPDGLYHYRIRENSIMTQEFSIKNVGICDAWKENYIFCKANYPKLEDISRVFWLEHIPAIIAQFPHKMNNEEKRAKNRLKREIFENLLFIIMKMPIKKIYYQVMALCFQ